jgi:hypothetical protein
MRAAISCTGRPFPENYAKQGLNVWRRTTWSEGGSGRPEESSERYVARNLCAALVLVSVSLASCTSVDAAEKRAVSLKPRPRRPAG